MASRWTFVAALVLVPRLAGAYGSGVAGFSGKQGPLCSQCHSGAAADAGPVTVALTGPLTLAAGATGSYTFTLSGGPGVVGGLDVAASAGSFSIGQAGTQVMLGEITQQSPIAFVAGQVTMLLNFTAPLTTGPVTLYASGVSANGNVGSAGDAAANTTLAVTVTSAIDGGVSDGGGRGDGGGHGDGGGIGPHDGGGGGHDGSVGGTPDLASAGTTNPPPPDMAHQRVTVGGSFLGCSAALGSSSTPPVLVILALALLAIALPRRRRS